LVRGLAGGEEHAFLEVYARFRVPLFAFLCRLCGQRTLAEDLFQRTWLKLLRSAPRLRADSDLKAWLFTVARNEHRSHRRWQLLDASRLMLLGLSPTPASVPDAESTALDLERALAALSVGDRETLLLAADGFDAEAAAAILNVSAEAYRKRLSRARQRLAETLQGQAPKRKPSEQSP
jgi:RNA polymerase sigma-70 factor (ECF subfamily)